MSAISAGRAIRGSRRSDGYRHLPEVMRWNELVHESVYAQLQRQRLPVLLGGDHCLSIGSISAVARHCREQRTKAARAVARCARGFQHQRALPER